MENGSTRGTAEKTPPSPSERPRGRWPAAIAVVGAAAAAAAILLPWADAEVNVQASEGTILGYRTAAISAVTEMGSMRGLDLDAAWAVTGLAGAVLIAAILSVLRPAHRRTMGLFVVLGGLAAIGGGVLGSLLPSALVQREVDAASREVSDGRFRSLADIGERLGPSLGLEGLSAEVEARPGIGPFVAGGAGALAATGGILLLTRGRLRRPAGGEA